MKLVAKSATSADFDTAKSVYGPEKGDLVAAAAAITWHIDASDLSAAKQRAEWSCQQQKELLENDPTTRAVKVVDEDNNDDIVAFGRWHRYPEGYQHVADLEVAGLGKRDDAQFWPAGINKTFHIGMLDPLFADRRRWMGTGHYWVLTNIKTREPFRKHGAGSLILEWGLQQARKEGVPAYLEAVVEAKGLYEKHGFRQVDTVTTDCTPFGIDGVHFTLARMRADP